MEARVGTLFHNTFVRYLFAIATVASTFALRLWLVPFTGTGAPFVLFFAAVLVTSLVAGIGPGICAIVISVPLAVYTFVTRAGDPPFQAAVQGLLFAVEGMVVVYLTFLMKKGRQAAQDANRQLRWANEEIIEIDGADTRGHRACARRIFPGGSRRPLHGRQPGRVPAPRLRTGRANWQDHLRHHSGRGRGPAEGAAGPIFFCPAG